MPLHSGLTQNLPPQILVFLAYYSETIPEASEAARSREIIIKYHTEDDTVALHEPRVSNAGLPQGKMLKRMRIPLAATRLPARELVGIMPPVRPSGPALRAAVPGEHLTWRELVVGEQLALFGRAMRILACDARTRRWYEAQGAAQPHDIVVHAPKPHHMSVAASPVPGGPTVAAAAPVPFYGKRVNPEKRYLEVGGKGGRGSQNAAPSNHLLLSPCVCAGHARLDLCNVDARHRGPGGAVPCARPARRLAVQGRLRR